MEHMNRPSATAEGKYCFWLNMPNHYQLDLMRAFEEKEIDIQVRFFGNIDDYRKKMGWDDSIFLNDNEKITPAEIGSLESVSDWRNRIHVVPGRIGDKFLLGLVDQFISNRVPWIHWSENSHPGLKSLIRLIFRKAYGRKIDAHAMGALAISKLAREEFKKWGIRDERISWLPYAASASRVNGREDGITKEFCKNKFLFAYCGALCYRKATDVLFRAFTDIVKEYDNIGLVLVGPDTKDKYYEKYAKRLGIWDRILFRGVMESKLVAGAISLCNVLILPSRHDGWGMVLAEAASLGKALIASDKCGASHHLILDGVNGYVIKSGRRQNLYEAMKRYAENRDLSRIHGRSSYEISKCFSPEANVERFLSAVKAFCNHTVG